jgi:hypothetical protein
MDTADFIFPPQRGPGVLSKPDGFLQLDDWLAYARQLPTLEQELARLPEPESPEVSGVWRATIGRTLCIQPGQLEGLTYVLVDTVSMQAVRKTAPLVRTDRARHVADQIR